MTHTNPQVEPTLDTTALTTPPSWVEAHEIVQDFSFEPAFIDALSATESQPSDITSVDYAKALSAYADTYCDKRKTDSSITLDLSSQIKLLANAPLYLHNEKELSYYGNEKHIRRLTDDEWQYYQDFKPYMIWYNQLLADYAYTNRRDTLSGLNNVLVQQALPYFPGEAEAVERNIKRATRGARTA
jgi:hypothetical protein